MQLQKYYLARKTPAAKCKNIDRSDDKLWWSNGYRNWDDDEFRHRLRIKQSTFEIIMENIEPYIIKQPTNMVPDPIESHRQIALTLYRLAHAVSFSTLADLFGVFNNVIRLFVQHMYDTYVKLPETDEEWKKEAIGFIENYGFPSIAAWDGFHVNIGSKLKNHFSFKKRYSISNMGLVAYNKRFLAAAVDAPGSTHDARLLRHTDVFNDIIGGRVIPNKTITLGDSYGEIPFVTIGDSAFPRFAWLLKGFPETTRDMKENFFNEKLHSARVVTENCYGMLKGRWRIIYKKIEIRKHNLKFVVMACIMLHNLCIHIDDPCNPRWQLDVTELFLNDKNIQRSENKEESIDKSKRISEWLWEHCAR